MLSGTSIQVLLVADFSAHLELIRAALKAWDQQVDITIACTLADARRRLEEGRPDLAIVDMFLTDGSGAELLPATREETAFPIIMLTDQENEKQALEAMRAGALDYLLKSPAKLTETAHIVERALREWRHIAERRRAENTLRESEERFRSFFYSSAIGMASISPEGKFLQVNPANCRLLGYSEEEMLRFTTQDITHPEDWADMRKVYEDLLASRQTSITYEKRYLRKDGSILWGHVTVAGIYDSQGMLLYFAGQMQDITERKLADQTLREREERWRSVFTIAAAAIVIISPTGKLLQVNPYTCHMLGYTEDELMELTVEGITHPDDRDRTSLHYGEIFAGTRKMLHYEKKYLCKDGRVVWGHASVACVLSASDKPAYCIGLVQDITEQKRVEEELRKSEQELKELIEASPVPMVISEKNHRIRYLNKKFTELFGYTTEDIPTLEAWWPLAFPDPEYREMLQTKWNATVEMAMGEKTVIDPQDAKVLCNDGSHRHVVFQLSAIGERELYVLHDITERVRMEEELRNANRELDAFVHTVSHDLRAPLTPIISFSELLQETYQETLDAQANGFLREILRHGYRMQHMLQDLLDLALTGNLERPAIPVSASDVVQESVLVAMPRLAEAGMRVETGELPSLRVPKTLLSQIFDNLIGNAIRYAGSGGTIEVGGERRGRKVLFSVRDHGPGIPEAERNRVFDLFYRCPSQAETEGTGVGLASVQKIASLFGGKAWVEETPGGGSTFWVEMADETS